ncbi:MAG: AAA family ATPase [Sphaerochaetaceae bacterium]
MKILSLRWNNLNSLYGQWSIDFTHPDYEANGIFALVGPTGAGKSTILDAICLALYGQTPRLGRITKSENEIMSRATGECSAEVVFESSQGTFICTWEQHRARRKPSGNLLDPRHEISDAVTKKPIETKRSQVPSVVEEKTGMDFDRFERSMLLAQGNFDTFLKAKIDDKSKILEQITGTEIYSTISQKVFERLKDEKLSLATLKESTAGFSLLTEEQIQQHNADLTDLGHQENQLSGKQESINGALLWLDSIRAIEEELEKISEDEVILSQRADQFKEKQILLENALLASKIETPYSLLTAKRKDQDSERTKLENKEKELDSVTVELQSVADSLQEQEKRRKKAESDLSECRKVLKEVRSLDQSLMALKEQKEGHEASINTVNGRIEKRTQKITSLKNEIDQLIKRIETDENYLKDHRSDRELINAISGIKEKFTALKNGEKDLLEKEETLNEQYREEFRCHLLLSKTEQNIYDLHLSLDDLKDQRKKTCEQRSDLLGGKELKELKMEKEHLLKEQRLLDKIVQLESEREKLLKGEPCPLCGSTVHPFTDDSEVYKDSNQEEIDTISSLIDKYSEFEDIIRNIDEKINLKQLELNHENENRERENSNLLKAQDSCRQSLSSCHERQKNIAEARSTLLEELSFYQIVDIDSNRNMILPSLEKRQKRYAEAEETVSNGTDTIRDMKHQITSAEDGVRQDRSDLEGLLTIKSSLEEQFSSNENRRKELFEDKDPDIEEENLEKKLEEEQEKEVNLRRSFHARSEQKTSLEALIGSLKSSVSTRKKELIEDERDFLLAMKAQGFDSESRFSESRLDADKIEQLSNEKKELETREQELKLSRTNAQKRLKTQQEKEVTCESKEALTAQSDDLKEQLKTVRDKKTQIEFALMENSKTLARIEKKQQEIQRQQKEVTRWEKLYSLIGAADGKRFRNYAQGLTFEVMISHANEQLRNMNDRYILIRDTEQPLELNVIDNYQAGEIRSTKNLSGGESFIISLSLALGLSQMASRKVRVDSLFLDEGFGTLDDEALDSALETLSTLQQKGKIIGIISHVSLLKERIGTKIVVKPTTGGKSVLEGSGITSG